MCLPSVYPCLFLSCTTHQIILSGRAQPAPESWTKEVAQPLLKSFFYFVAWQALHQ